MIVRDFLDWVRTAPAGKRAEATSALARAYLYSDLSPDDLGAAEGAMLMLLDDPSPLVRRALADALAASPSAPPAIVLALAADHPDIAAPVLALSPLFVDADLVDAVATGTPAVQTAIASRAALPRSVAAAIAEVGTEESCLALLQKHDADIAPFSIDRIVERHGHLAAVRGLTLARDDLSVATRQILVAKLSQTLAGFVAEREWLGKEQAWRIAREACERATVVLAAETPMSEVGPLIRHLRGSGSTPASSCAPCCRATSRSSRRHWPSLPICRSPACRRWCTTAAAPGCGRCWTGRDCRLRPIPPSRPRSRLCTRVDSSASPAARRRLKSMRTMRTPAARQAPNPAPPSVRICR